MVKFKKIITVCAAIFQQVCNRRVSGVACYETGYGLFCDYQH